MTLPGNEVHVWAIPTSHAGSDALVQLGRVLSAEERQRAGRFYFAADREIFVVARGALRTLVGRYLSIPPAGIAFDYTAKGKPFLPSIDSLQFNISHTRGMAVLAFVQTIPIGVDVELVRPMDNLRDIAARYFTPAETAGILERSGADCEHAFFACWTRKEALIKATGDGLSMPLNSFTVSVRPDEPARLIRIEHRDWALHDLDLATPHIGAVAYPGPARPIRAFTGMEAVLAE